jgi:hypothetical protein
LPAWPSAIVQNGCKFFHFSQKTKQTPSGIALSQAMQVAAFAGYCSQANGFITFAFIRPHMANIIFSSCCHPVDCFSLFSDFLYQRSEKDQADF